MTYTRVNVKVKGQLVLKLGKKQTNGRTNITDRITCPANEVGYKVECSVWKKLQRQMCKVNFVSFNCVCSKLLDRCHTCDFIARFCRVTSSSDKVAVCDCAVARCDFVA